VASGSAREEVGGLAIEGSASSNACPAGDRRLSSLRAALAFLRLGADAPELRLLHRWLDSWTGLGLIVAGMTRQGFQLGLDQRTGQWLAIF
jgi:hypothetical protein